MKKPQLQVQAFSSVKLGRPTPPDVSGLMRTDLQLRKRTLVDVLNSRKKFLSANGELG